MPWSISPRLASGSRMYSLLSSHVFAGDGRSLTARLAAHQMPSAMVMPTSGSNRFLMRSAIETVNLEGLRIGLGILSVEGAIEERDLLLLRRGGLHAELFHRLEVQVGPEHALRNP